MNGLSIANFVDRVRNADLDELARLQAFAALASEDREAVLLHYALENREAIAELRVELRAEIRVVRRGALRQAFGAIGGSVGGFVGGVATALRWGAM